MGGEGGAMHEKNENFTHVLRSYSFLGTIFHLSCSDRLCKAGLRGCATWLGESGDAGARTMGGKRGGGDAARHSSSRWIRLSARWRLTCGDNSTFDLANKSTSPFLTIALSVCKNKHSFHL